VERLRDHGIPVLATHEPGGTPLGDQLRQLVLLREDLAVTARAVKLARVLSDESRVRAIQLLAVEPMSLMELAAKLDLNKSTIHHHLAELRAAGLLRVPMGTKRYSLRPEALYRFGTLLGDLAKPARYKPRKEKK